MQLHAANLDQLDFAKSAGLLPAIIQHAYSGEVLMQGYMNSEALAVSLRTEQVTFYSRSKQRLWTKGERSGDVLHLQSAHSDCDNDSILILALPAGPTCHLGTTSCFASTDAAHVPELERLQQRVSVRAAESPEHSYTAKLIADGVKRCAQKVGEEGVEVALAAAVKDRDELLNESADLLYHLLVVLKASELELNDVLKVLATRRDA